MSRIKIWIIVLYSAIQTPSFAQELVKSLPEQPWDVVETLKDQENSVVPQNETIISVAMKKKEYGIACLNDKGVKWITNLDDKPERILLFRKNILVIFYSKKVYRASLINPSNGKILVSKDIYTADSDYYQTVSYFTGNKGDFFKLSVRSTLVKKGVKIVPFYIGMKNILRNLQKYSRIETIGFTDDLSITSKDVIEPATPPGYFSSVCDAKGNIVIGSYDNNANNLFFSKYQTGNLSPVGSIRVPIEPRNDDAVESFMLQQSDRNDDIVFFGISYKNDDKDYVIELNKLDFKAGKYISTKDVLDKKYLKSLESSFTPINKDDDKPDMKDLNSWLDITKVYEQDDKIIVCKESSTMYPRNSPSGSDSYRWESGIVSIYDNTLQKRLDQVISNDYNNMTPEGGGFEYRIHNNKLLILGNHEYHYGYYHTYIWQLNLTTGKLEKKIELEKDGLKKISFIKPSETIWFKNAFMLTYSAGKNETVFKKYNSTF